MDVSQRWRYSKVTGLNINETALHESNCARFFEFTVQFTPATGQFDPRPSNLDLNQWVHQTWRGIIFNISIFLLTKKTMVGYRLLIVIVCRTFIEIFFHLLLVLNRGVSVKDYIKYRLVHMTWTDIILHSLMWSIYIARCSWQWLILMENRLLTVRKSSVIWAFCLSVVLIRYDLIIQII